MEQQDAVTGEWVNYTPEREARLERRSRYLFRRLLWFWPIVTNVDDVERVSLFGYWVCVIIALINLVSVVILLAQAPLSSGTALASLAGTAYCCFYFLGGNAIRLRNVPAGIFVTVAAGLNVCNGLLLNERLEFDRVVEFLLLVIALRGTYLATNYKPKADEGPPLRLFEFLGHKPADRWPQQIWPRLQVAFWISGALVVCVTIGGVLLALAQRFTK